MANSNPKQLTWYHTTVFRAAVLALIIVGGSYVASLVSIRQALQGFSRMAYDEELATALTDSLALLKELDTAKRQALLFRIRELRPHYPKDLSENQLSQLLEAAGIDDIAPFNSLQIERAETASGSLQWISRTELSIDPFLLKVPTSDVREQFEHLQAVRQRYDLIRATWDQEIAPSLLTSHRLILLASTLLLTLLLLLLVRRYIREAHTLLRGLRRWSQNDSNFRFVDNFSGELSTFARQFNEMADEVALTRSRSEYLEKIASWQTMGRKLAHEIKNPLTPIQMMVSQLRSRYKGEDPQYQNLLEEATNIITEEIQALRRMVDHFSQFAKLPEPQLQISDLTQVCQQVFDLEAAAFPQHRFIWEGSRDSVMIAFDPQLIRQVILNLIKNAAEASEQRTATIILRIVVTAESSTVKVEVEDDGPGIPASDLERIWEAYFTSKHTGPNPGMGLGLAISRKIAIDHRGELSVRSRAGQTTFQLLLPKESPERQERN